jgi:hypothetical protein
MRKLLILAFLLPLMAWGQSSLPPCPVAGVKHNCFGSITFANGDKYVGEFRDGKANGQGTATYANSDKYVGEFRDDKPRGQGEFTFLNGNKWIGEVLDSTLGRGVLHFPNGSQVDTFPLSEAQITHATIVRDRLTQERESMLAEAKEHERQQAPQPQRPQAVLRNERRLALIIGNSNYKVSPLDNPANDATDIAESLKKFGFQTTLVRNATLGQMREATRKFADQLPSADVALIYFAGHGIEANRKNYMIPVNADLKFEYELADQGYDAGIWLEMLESIKSNNADRVNIVILDACRNNSLIGARNLGRGLGKMDAPSGTFLAYSTAPGKVAADGGRGERNSPFTKHLLRAMQQPNQPIEEVFKEVRRNVGKETNGAQVPWESTSLTGFFTFRQSR